MNSEQVLERIFDCLFPTYPFSNKVTDVMWHEFVDGRQYDDQAVSTSTRFQLSSFTWKTLPKSQHYFALYFQYFSDSDKIQLLPHALLMCCNPLVSPELPEIILDYLDDSFEAKLEDRASQSYFNLTNLQWFAVFSALQVIRADNDRFGQLEPETSDSDRKIDDLSSKIRQYFSNQQLNE